MSESVLRRGLFAAGFVWSLHTSMALAAVEPLPALLPPQVDYAKVCKLKNRLARDTHNWNNIETQAARISGRDLTEIGKLYLKGSAQQPSNPLLAHKILKAAAAKPGRHRGAALLLLADTYAKGLGTAQDGVIAKQTLEEALTLSTRGAGFALGSIYESEGEFTKAGNAYAKDAALKNPAAALSLAVLYKSEKMPEPREGAANEMVALAQNMLLERVAQGDCDALTVLGNIYLRGETVQRDEKTAAKWLQAATQGDNVSAMLTLATLYQRGVGVAHDREKVQQLWERAAALGSSEAMYDLGFSYVFGDYVDQDIPKGIPWLEKAAERYYLEAMHLLFRVYRGDYGGQVNHKLAMQWLHKAAAHPAAETSIIFELAQAYEEGKLTARDYGKALEYYQLAAKLGDEDAPYKVGELYQRALGTPPQPKLALRFYRLAASRGSKQAMMAMYYNYYCGIAVSYDAVKAQRWLDRAIANASFDGIQRAQQEYQSRGTEEDYDHAVALLTRAVEMDDRKAMIALAEIYMEGRPGVEKNREKAESLLEQAILPGENRAQGLSSLASLYLKGRLVQRDVKKGLSLLTEAAKYNDSDALRQLGMLYMKGQPEVPADVNQGLTYLQQAADFGNAQAMLTLAEYYRANAKDQQGRDAALDWYVEAGVHGDPTAAVTLAEFYRHGTGVREDPKRAEEWLTRAQSPESCSIPKSMTVARMFSQGMGTEKDPKKAAEWFQRALRFPAVQTSDMKALAEAYTFGYGTRQDYAKALEWETKLAELGETRHMRNVARMHLEGRGTVQDVELAREWYDRAAKAGDALAYIDLANLYEKGIGVEKNPPQAKAYLEQAATMGSSRALRILAERALQAKDYAEAVRWYQQAAKTGDVKAMFRLVSLYNDPAIPIHDQAQVKRWVQQAIKAAESDPNEMARIGEAYMTGLGVEKNSKAAAEWFYKAGEAGSAKGMRMLGKMYMEGNGVPQDRSIAVSWLNKAAEKGDLSAMVAVAEAYSTGSGVQLDFDKASEFYRAAAQHGSTKAMREIGFLYMRGRGVERNESYGIQWLTSAAERGDVRAMEELARSYAAGFGVEESSQEALSWWKRAADAGSTEARRQLEIAVQTGYAPANFLKE
jgi:TPR repeat protein